MLGIAESLVDFLQLLLSLVCKVHAVTGKGLVEFFQCHLLLAVQTALVSFINGLYSLEELAVHEDFVAVGGKKLIGLVFNLADGRIRICLCEVEKHTADFSEKLSGKLVCRNGVGKVRSFGIVNDGLDFLLVLLYTFLYGRDIVFCLDLVKRRNSVRSIPVRKERILVFARCNHHKYRK